MRGALGVLAVVLGLLGGPVQAGVNPDEVLADPGLEARARALGKELRCLVCQNQSIDDSDADLARDLRQIVREQLLAGKTDQQIIDYMTARYGDFVLLKPPVNPATWALWFGPALVLAIAASGVAVYVRSRATRADHRPTDLNPDERRRLDALLKEDSATPGA